MEVQVLGDMMLNGEGLDCLFYTSSLNAPSWDVKIKQLMLTMSYPYGMEEVNSTKVIVDLSVMHITQRAREEIKLK